LSTHAHRAQCFVGVPAQRKAELLLRETLTRFLLRTRPLDRHRDVRLPPVRERYTILTLSTAESVIYNEVVSQIRANLLLSGGQGQDSLADPRNQRYALSALSALHQSCCWKPRLTVSQRASTLRNIDAHLRTLAARDPTFSPASPLHCALSALRTPLLTELHPAEDAYLHSRRASHSEMRSGRLEEEIHHEADVVPHEIHY
jgi:hypothetical protein